MDYCLIISGNTNYYQSIKNYIESKLNKIAIFIKIPENIYRNRCRLLELYSLISDKIELVGEENGEQKRILYKSVAILDLPFYDADINNYDPLSRENSLKQLASLLVLSFPEIHWVFPLCTGGPLESEDLHFIKRIDLINKLDQVLNMPPALFDASGLRNKIKTLIVKSSWHGNELNYIRIREKLAASIDEEQPYAYLHGYTAYKTGYRCILVTRRSILDKYFKNNSSYHFNVIFEDLYLNFPDRIDRLSDLCLRDSQYPVLAEASKRYFITVGHKYRKIIGENKEYIRERKKVQEIKTIFKPSGGIFNILDQTGLIKVYRLNKRDEIKSSEPKELAREASSHSAPGKLLLIAEKLVQRAKMILRTGNCVEELIYGATLALDAQELLGNRTPTTSLEAIALKHQLEARAECMFYGVGFNLDMKNRFKEIEDEVEAVSKWFNPSIKKRAFINAQLGILTELVEIMRDFGQFDEEIQCLKKIRKLNREFYFLNKPVLRFIQPMRAYIETLIGSFPLFLGAIFFWPTLYGILGYVTKARFTGSETFLFWEQLTNAYYTFFGLQPTLGPIGTWSNIISILTVLTGFLHLGIFISFLYSLIFRK